MPVGLHIGFLGEYVQEPLVRFLEFVKVMIGSSSSRRRGLGQESFE